MQQVPPSPPSLARLLECHQRELLRLVGSVARGLLRYETEDLQQEINLHALRVAHRFVYRGEREFLGWLAQVARQRIATRLRAFAARRRNLGVLRPLGHRPALLQAGAIDPFAPEPGPVALADRKEQIALLQQVLRALMPRDRDLLTWTAAGMPVEEIAQRLGLSRGSANRARQRAVKRLRAAFLDVFEQAARDENLVQPAMHRAARCN